MHGPLFFSQLTFIYHTIVPLFCMAPHVEQQQRTSGNNFDSIHRCYCANKKVLNNRSSILLDYINAVMHGGIFISVKERVDLSFVPLRVQLKVSFCIVSKRKKGEKTWTKNYSIVTLYAAIRANAIYNRVKVYSVWIATNNAEK